MRIFKYNVYITILSTDKNLHVRDFQIYAALKWRYCITDERWRCAWGSLAICSYNSNPWSSRNLWLCARDTVELVTNMCHFSLSRVNVAHHPVQLLLLVRLCILYVCISNDTTSSTRNMEDVGSNLESLVSITVYYTLWI